MKSGEIPAATYSPQAQGGGHFLFFVLSIDEYIVITFSNNRTIMTSIFHKENRVVIDVIKVSVKRHLLNNYY